MRLLGELTILQLGMMGDEKYRKSYEYIEDESINGNIMRVDKWHYWDEAVWNTEGAYAPPISDSSPSWAPKGLYKFEKEQKPTAK